MNKFNYSKTQINEAGYAIAKDSSPKTNTLNIKIIDSWRSLHAEPINILSTKLKSFLKNYKDVIIAHRLKRLDTIINKLHRYPNMNLSRMQDLGGCRVILPTIEDVYLLKNKLLKQKRFPFVLHHEKDYIKTPDSETGYRGVHLIFTYRIPENNTNIFIELQIRTKLQHLWATAVETVGMFTNNSLKFNQGNKDWIKYFKIASLIFQEEEFPRITNFKFMNNHLKIISKSFELDKKCKVDNTVYKIAAVKYIFDEAIKDIKPGYYLLQLNIKKSTLKITHYNNNRESRDKAILDYSIAETKKNDREDIVLVSTKSITDLQEAYPNYFANISEFQELLLKYKQKQINMCKTIIKKYKDFLKLK